MFPAFFTNERFIHSLKTAFACLLGFVFSQSFSIHPDPWLVITIIVVMCAQINVGSMLQKSYMRFLGTLGGSLIAGITIQFLGTDELTIALVVGFSALFFSFIATGQGKLSDAGTLGAVTVTIILIGQTPTLQTTFHRFSEISIGILLAGLISQFILPIHARSHLRASQAHTIRSLRTYYLETVMSDQKTETVELDETIVKSLIAQRKLAVDAAREPLGVSFNIGHFNQYLWYAREILRSMNFMYETYRASDVCKQLFSQAVILKNFHEKICEALQEVATRIEKNNIAIPVIFVPDLDVLQNFLSAEKNIEEKDMLYIHTFLFCADILITHLKNLIELIHQKNST